MTNKELISRLERAATTSGLHVRVEATLLVAAVDELRKLSERVEQAEAVLEAGGTRATAIIATWNRARDDEQALAAMTERVEKAEAQRDERHPGWYDEQQRHIDAAEAALADLQAKVRKAVRAYRENQENNSVDADSPMLDLEEVLAQLPKEPEDD